MSEKALGLLETIGMAAAVEAADAALKSADVSLIGYELTKGYGMITVKIEGDVGAVKAALEAAKESASRVNRVCSALIIPRPSENLDGIKRSSLTVGIENKKVLSSEDLAEGNYKEESKGKCEEAELQIKEETKGEAKEEICNICGDPACPRKKGQPRNLCIHYKKDGPVKDDE
ncbi:BMC domain-containing protein [Fonticella tunisiensis]|uniref:Microcompartment protein CcmL/EutN n=1 Tax=Fonticella tunisiensis TaxID=1096341 RepID=A0A4R7K9D9_9CLOT|nr:BMC domain-containing protein [Fonticella tunisiensis]TDT50362.1 microcompartment protein CcmL/EutN [Fonticella tunisiensis]